MWKFFPTLKQIRIIWILVLSLAGPALPAQIDWELPALEIREHDGLPSTYIRDVIEDKHGFIWIATYAGIVRFDGYQLTPLQDSILPQSEFNDILYDEQRDLLWIGNSYGLFSYHLPTEQVRRYKTVENLGENQIQHLALSADAGLWIGTRNRLAHLPSGADSLITIELNDPDRGLPVTDIKCILPDPARQNRLWLSTDVGMLCYYMDSGHVQYCADMIDVDHLRHVNTMAVNPSSGYIYFGISSIRNNPNDYNYIVLDSRRDEVVDAILIDPLWENRNISFLRDSIALLSGSSGFAYYHERSKQLGTVHRNEAGDPIGYRGYFVDSRDNVWSGSTEGIRMYRTATTPGKSYYYEADFPGWYHVVTSCYYDQEEGSLYLGVFGGEGLYRFDLSQRSWHIYPYLSPDGRQLKTDFTGVGRGANGEISVLGNGGYYQLNEDGGIEKTQAPFPGRHMWLNGFWDTQQRLLGTTSRGVVTTAANDYQLEDITEQVYYCEANTGEEIYWEDSRGNVWIGGLCGGFNQIDGRSGQVHSFASPELSSGSIISGISEWDGFVWAQTGEGDIYVVDVRKPDLGIIENIPLREWVDNRRIDLVNSESFEAELFIGGVFDRQGRFWFLCAQGIYCFDRANGRLELFDESVGITVKDPQMNVFVGNQGVCLADGTIAFTTRKGICWFDPVRLSNRIDLAKPYIRAVNINNELAVADTAGLFKRAYRLGPRENFVGFDFSALAFDHPGDVRFRYKLAGVDKEWKDPGDRRFISYSQLKGGEYTFQLQAANAAGVWSEEEARIQLRIDKFWYQRTWAKGLFLIVFVVGILAIYFSRLRRAIEREQLKIQYERELTEIKMQALTAQMNPHFIFNSLNSIDFYIIKNDTRKASQYLNRFSRLMRLILKNSRANYVALKDDLEALKLYLEIEALRFSHRFRYELVLDDNIDQDFLKIPPMLVQPYVENSIWHGLLHKRDDGCIRIHYTFDEEREVLRCTVTDNGIGRERSIELKQSSNGKKERKSFGMNITKNKIEAMKFLHGIDASVSITDLYNDAQEGSGTQVELIIPV